MFQGEGKIIRPDFDKGTQENGYKYDEDKNTGNPTIEGEGPFFKGPRRLKKWTSLPTDEGVTLFSKIIVQKKGSNGRDEEDHADGCSQIESLHSNDLLVDLCGQDTIIPTDDDGDTKIGNRQIES